MTTEIWESRCCDKRAVTHGCATRYISWVRDGDKRWHMLGAFWKRAEAEAVARAYLSMPEHDA